MQGKKSLTIIIKKYISLEESQGYYKEARLRLTRIGIGNNSLAMALWAQSTVGTKQIKPTKQIKQGCELLVERISESPSTSEWLLSCLPPNFKLNHRIKGSR